MAADSIRAILGDKVVNGDGNAVDLESFCGDGTMIGVYFSAHWCPPCRGFTPKLAECYEAIKAKGGKLEIVFVSSDRDQASFDDYFKTMPWLALPYEDRDQKGKLSTQYGVRGIPTLVLLDGANGKTITTDGRSKVMSDLDGSKFPEGWSS